MTGECFCPADEESAFMFLVWERWKSMQVNCGGYGSLFVEYQVEITSNLTPLPSENESDGSELERPFEAYQTSNCGGSFLALKVWKPGLTSELLPSYGPSVVALVGSPDFDPKGKNISRASFLVKSVDKPRLEESSKKPRRCWSPELHRLFVEALEQLGGAHKETPKKRCMLKG